MTLGREGNRNVQTSQGSDVGSFPPALRLIFKMATNRMSDFARLSPEWITFECHAHDSSNFAEKVFSKPLATTRGSATPGLCGRVEESHEGLDHENIQNVWFNDELRLTFS